MMMCNQGSKWLLKTGTLFCAGGIRLSVSELCRKKVLGSGVLAVLVVGHALRWKLVPKGCVMYKAASKWNVERESKTSGFNRRYELSRLNNA